MCARHPQPRRHRSSAAPEVQANNLLVAALINERCCEKTAQWPVLSVCCVNFFWCWGGWWSGEKRLETEGCATHMLFELLNRKKVLITLKKWTATVRHGPAAGGGCCCMPWFWLRIPADGIKFHYCRCVTCHSHCLFVCFLCVPPRARCGCPRCFDFPFFCWSAAMRLPRRCAVAEGILWAVSRARSFLKIRAGLFDVAALQNQEKAL